MLRPSSRNLNCVCFVRTISDIDKHLASEHASNFCDVIRQDGGKPVRDEAKKKALKELKQKLKVYNMYMYMIVQYMYTVHLSTMNMQVHN